MRWWMWLKRRLAWLLQQRTKIKQAFPTLATLLVIAALAGTFYGIAQARNHSTAPKAADAASTATPETPPTATPSLPPLSGPIPTIPSGGVTYATPTGKAPFMPTSVTAGDGCMGGTVDCNDQIVAYCPTADTVYPIVIPGYIYMPWNAPDGYITYRWRLSDGTVTAPATEHYSWNDQYGQNQVKYYWPVNPAIADGHEFWAQLEVLSPVSMISAPSPHYSVTCLPSVSEAYNPTSVGNTDLYYDCATGGAQTFSFAAAADIILSPSFTFSYYWLRPDGSVSPTRTITTPAGAASIPLQDDSITLTYPSPPPATDSSPIATYSETVVITNAPAIRQQASIHTIQSKVGDVIMPNCNSSLPPATPTPTANPTATAIPPTSTP